MNGLGLLLASLAWLGIIGLLVAVLVLGSREDNYEDSAMPEPDWTAEATIEAAKLVRMNPLAPSRGVMKSNRPGVSVVFARSSEVPRLNQRLDDAGVETLGQGNALGPFLDYTVAVLVRSEDVRRLLAIVRAGSNP